MKLFLKSLRDKLLISLYVLLIQSMSSEQIESIKVVENLSVFGIIITSELPKLLFTESYRQPLSGTL
ncbi:hypothetical protein BJQ96_02248 [Flavobacterium sp. PL0002]|nr:hypothetical protein [Flavobacterium sp. PL002]